MSDDKTQKTVYLFDSSVSDYRSGLETLVSFLRKKLAEVPDEYKSNCEVEFKGCIFCQISYTRPETDEERISRLQQKAIEDEDQRRRDLQELRRLQKKLGLDC